jgi:hypothetical protein
MALSFIVSAGTRIAGTCIHAPSTPMKTAFLQQGLEMAACGVSSHYLKRAFNNELRTNGDRGLWRLLLLVSRIAIAAGVTFAASRVSHPRMGLVEALSITFLVPAPVMLARRIYDRITGQRTPPPLVYW